MRWLRPFSRVLLAVFFVIAGINHFRDPAVYLGMMPKWLPWPDKLQLLAGAAEVAGGLGVLVPGLRRWAAWGLLLLLVAVFPANLQVALHGWPGAPFAVPPWILWARLPLQAVLMAWVWWTFLKRQGPTGGDHSVRPVP